MNTNTKELTRKEENVNLLSYTDPETGTVFDVTVAQAEHGLGIKYQSLYRWARSGDIEVHKVQGPYGPENVYNKEQLLSMRHGKNKKSNKDAPANKMGELVAIDQLNKALASVGLSVTTIQDQLQKLGQWHEDAMDAKNETIDVLRQANQRHEELGKKDHEISALKTTISTLEEKIKALTPKKRKKWFGLFLWVLLALTLITTVTFAAILQQ